MNMVCRVGQCIVVSLCHFRFLVLKLRHPGLKSLLVEVPFNPIPMRLADAGIIDVVDRLLLSEGGLKAVHGLLSLFQLLMECQAFSAHAVEVLDRTIVLATEVFVRSGTLDTSFTFLMIRMLVCLTLAGVIREIRHLLASSAQHASHVVKYSIQVDELLIAVAVLGPSVIVWSRRLSCLVDENHLTRLEGIQDLGIRALTGIALSCSPALLISCWEVIMRETGHSVPLVQLNEILAFFGGMS